MKLTLILFNLQYSLLSPSHFLLITRKVLLSTKSLYLRYRGKENPTPKKGIGLLEGGGRNHGTIYMLYRMAE
jgi:hypothetical protein